MNTLPMKEDMRQYSFATFRQELRPKQFPEPQQLQMARDLVAAFDLTAGAFPRPPPSWVTCTPSPLRKALVPSMMVFQCHVYKCWVLHPMSKYCP